MCSREACGKCVSSVPTARHRMKEEQMQHKKPENCMDRFPKREEDLAASTANREELRFKLRALQDENHELNRELARLRQEQSMGVCKRDTCVGYEERIARLSTFYRSLVAEFSDRFRDPDAISQRIVDTLVAAANTSTLECLEELLARMQERPPRELSSGKLFVQDVMLLEQSILSNHHKMLLEEEELKQRNAEVRRHVQMLNMVAGEKGSEAITAPKVHMTTKPVRHMMPGRDARPLSPASKRRAFKRAQPEGLLRPPSAKALPERLMHPAFKARTARVDRAKHGEIPMHQQRA